MPPKTIFGATVREDAHAVISAAGIAQRAGKKNKKYRADESNYHNKAEDVLDSHDPRSSNEISKLILNGMSAKELDVLVGKFVADHFSSLTSDLESALADYAENLYSNVMESKSIELFDLSVVKIKESLRPMKEELQSKIDALESSKSLTVNLVAGKQKTSTNLGLVHEKFEQLLKCASATTANGRLNIWLSGEAGSGKTTAATQVAKALNLPFYFNGAIDSEYSLSGFIDAQGRIVSKPFREAYSSGGIFLFDEIDASMPSALLAFNAALSNNMYAFPDKIVYRHKDCVILAGANTHGQGASSHYVGRNRQDGAFLDRFVYINWNTDEDLEINTSPNKEWTLFCQRVRSNVKNKGITALITPRSSYYGATLLELGLPVSTVMDMVLRKGMTNEVWSQAIQDVKPYRPSS